MKRRKHSRKDRCEDCGVSSGSLHSKDCKWAYAPRNSKKTQEMSLKKKLKTIIQVIKS